jgi:hypothetical protein
LPCDVSYGDVGCTVEPFHSNMVLMLTRNNTDNRELANAKTCSVLLLPYNRVTRKKICFKGNHIVYSASHMKLFYYDVYNFNFRPRKTRLTAVGIRCTDHATPSTRKGWH